MVRVSTSGTACSQAGLALSLASQLLLPLESDLKVPLRAHSRRPPSPVTNHQDRSHERGMPGKQVA
jgi:hypothetical protein